MIPYLNLTSGLEFAPEVPNFRLVRIQSSNFESNKMWAAVMDTDYSFLIDAALHGVLLHDCGSRRGAETRVQWKGVPWFLYTFHRANTGNPTPSRYEREFDHYYQFGDDEKVRHKAKAKLRYVGRLTGKDTLIINCVSKVSTLDGKVEELSTLAGLRGR